MLEGWVCHLRNLIGLHAPQELGSLTGLRSYYSTALEAFDFLAPLLERLFSRIGDAGDIPSSYTML